MNCYICDSQDIIKFGFNYFKGYKKQKYKCCSCGKIFCDYKKLPKHRISSEIMDVSLDCYMDGFSYRIMKRHLNLRYGISPSHVTIYNWIQEISKELKKYVHSLKPDVGAVWQIDETFIQFKGTWQGKRENPLGAWLWICIDTKTRYVINAKLTVDKSMESGKEFFEEMKALNVEPPEAICTDGNHTYFSCVEKYYPHAVHLPIKHISVKPNTSFIERFNGTIKNRTKIMRGFDSFLPCDKTLKLFTIYYNFLRPHMALENRTPAQEAGIDLELPDRWSSLIKIAQVANHYS